MAPPETDNSTIDSLSEKLGYNEDPMAVIGEKQHDREDIRKIVLQKPSSPKAIVLHAIMGSLGSYLIAYGIRGGVNFLLNLLAVYRKRKGTIVRAFTRGFFGIDALRFGAAFGSFSFLWKLINNGLRYIRKKDDKWNSFIAGSIAGISLIVEKQERRIMITQQMFVRAVQALYKSGRTREYFDIPHIGLILFILSCGQVLYAYTMQPTTIPPDFLKFMIKTARVPKDTLNLNLKHLREGGINLDDALNVVVKGKGTQKAFDAVSKLSSNPIAIPCELVHPRFDSCTHTNIDRFYQVFKTIFPVYATLNIVPMFVFKINQFLKDPYTLIQKCTKNTIRSSIFLSTFVTSYQSQICIHRSLIKYIGLNFHSKYLYWLSGVIAGFAILIEHRNRRNDLTLYVVPKAMESLYKIMCQKNCIFELHRTADIWFFSAAMGVIMTCFQHEPKVLSPMTKTLLRGFFGTN
ncbi:9018_t:CDS:2 [Cetraspora pellucida]|uniref:9018_t:CDS:1 n=2 Tax=Cetraspora pellucida TaxID=1433469 RepID=A0A9N8Z9D8_9GLOM|nr:9018_t:CDS:2 [Cetraspora pellucida]